uniref:Uncharacterized protein n=1 Tax=Cyanothece sp. (strain PCC 7425 / ATCC 29141) TaxID=395961 RepID=B8HQ42_CYAP4
MKQYHRNSKFATMRLDEGMIPIPGANNLAQAGEQCKSMAKPPTQSSF